MKSRAMNRTQLNRLICWRQLIPFAPTDSYWMLFVLRSRN